MTGMRSQKVHFVSRQRENAVSPTGKCGRKTKVDLGADIFPDNGWS